MRAVGTIGKPHGIRGDVYVRTEFPEVFQPGAQLTVGSEPMTVAGARHHGNRFLVRFEEATDRNAAEELRGLSVSVGGDVALAEGEYLIEDLIGRSVQIVDREQTATIVDVVTTSPQHRLVLELGGATYEVPFHPDIVADVDGELSVDPPAGLFD